MEYLQIAKELSLKVYPNHPIILAFLGVGYYKQNKYTEALQLLRKAEEGNTLYNHMLHNNILEVEEAIARENEGI